MATLLAPFLFTNFCLALLFLQKPLHVDGTTQLLSADQANRMARKMVDGAVELVRQKYRLERGWKAGSRKEGGKEEEDEADNERKAHVKHQHQQHHHHRHAGHYGHHGHAHRGHAKALKYVDEEEMKRAKARGKQLLDALGVRDEEEKPEEDSDPKGGENKRNGTGAGGASTMTMRSLFGKFTRREK